MGRDENRALLAELTECEERVWQALVRGDPQADAAALSDDFLGVYSDGFATKGDHVAQLGNGPTVQAYALSELRVLALGEDHAVLSYRADYCRQRCEEIEAMFVSSIWRREGMGWINIFSQDTPWAEVSPP